MICFFLLCVLRCLDVGFSGTATAGLSRLNTLPSLVCLVQQQAYKRKPFALCMCQSQGGGGMSVFCVGAEEEGVFVFSDWL